VTDATHKTRSRGERVFAAIIGLVFVGQFCLAWPCPSDPRLFPMIVAIAGLLLMAAVLAQSRAKPLMLAAASREERRRTALALLAPPLYALALWAFGFWVVSIVAIPLLSWLLGYRSRAGIVVGTAGVVLAVGLLFPLVNVALPKSALFSALFGPHFPF